MGGDFSTGPLDWDDARYFLAVYRGGSLLKAAKTLGVSHSTVRRRLAGLESALGVKLFTATGEGVLPTDAAQKAFDLAERVEESIGQFGDRLRGETRELTGTLVVTSVDAMAPLLAPAITAYIERNPKVEIILKTDNEPLDLRRREADIAIRSTNKPDDNLFGRKVGFADYRPFASRALIDRYGNRIQEMPWVLYDYAAEASGTEEWFRQNVTAERPAVRVGDTSAMMALVSEGIGAAVLPEPCAAVAELEPIGEVIEDFRTDIWCLCHRDLRESGRVRAFMDLTASHLSLRRVGSCVARDDPANP